MLVAWGVPGMAQPDLRRDAKLLDEPASGNAVAGLPRHQAWGRAESGTWGALIASSSVTGDDTDTFAGLQVTAFVLDRLELGGEVAQFTSFRDGGREALGFSLSAVGRYHIVDRSWGSVFGDVGLGGVYSSEAVPEGGTNLNFLPRVGGGVSFRTSERSRILVGARWHHISNGRLNGDDENPARDELLVFVGWQFAF